MPSSCWLGWLGWLAAVRPTAGSVGCVWGLVDELVQQGVHLAGSLHHHHVTGPVNHRQLRQLHHLQQPTPHCNWQMFNQNKPEALQVNYWKDLQSAVNKKCTMNIFIWMHVVLNIYITPLPQVTKCDWVVYVWIILQCRVPKQWFPTLKLKVSKFCSLMCYTRHSKITMVSMHKELRTFILFSMKLM